MSTPFPSATSKSKAGTTVSEIPRTETEGIPEQTQGNENHSGDLWNFQEQKDQ